MGLFKDMFSANKMMELTELTERVKLYKKFGKSLENDNEQKNKQGRKNENSN